MGYETKSRPVMTLFAGGGERKYLNAAERERFYAALDVLTCPIERTFCEFIFWTGCRPSEALNMRRENISLAEGHAVIASLKKRGGQKNRHYRTVPLPPQFLARLEEAHGLASSGGEPCARLWRFSRTTGWARMAKVMKAAGLDGIRACARGLRHSFGVHAAMMRVPETRIRKWLGHASLATTEIYLDLAGDEDRAIAARMWSGGPVRQFGTFSLPADPANDITGAEIIRLVCAYGSIAAKAPRMALLSGIEESLAGGSENRDAA